jgi:cytochrome c-type biogenesis protein CcmH
MKTLFLAAVLALALLPAAYAIGPDEMLQDPALEMRARNIGQSLRCLVCQNQSIDDSDASLARDIRILVRERLTAGDTDQKVVAYIVSRYGDFVLLKPPMKPETWALWFSPALLITIAGTVIFIRSRRKRIVNQTPLTAEEEKALARLIETGERP